MKSKRITYVVLKRSALCISRNSTASIWPLRHACINAVMPTSLHRSTFAPLLNRSCICKTDCMFALKFVTEKAVTILQVNKKPTYFILVEHLYLAICPRTLSIKQSTLLGIYHHTPNISKQ